MSDDDSFQPIGKLAAVVVVKSTLTRVKDDWQTIEQDNPDWIISINQEGKSLRQQHHPSLTRSVVRFGTKGIVLRVDVFHTASGALCGDGHWYRVHALMAEKLLRVHGPK